MQLDDIDWAAKPWKAVTDDDLRAALAVPSMLTMDEARLYYWLAARAEGSGAVIDLGTHRGGSAARLLAGLATSASAAPLYTYDRFVTPEGEGDMLTQVQTALAPWGARVTCVKGDIARQAWTGGAVEILSVDAAKSPVTADRIAAEFFPALEPYRSVLIQQDFLHAKQPWLPVQMAALADCFRRVDRQDPARPAGRSGATVQPAPARPTLCRSARHGDGQPRRARRLADETLGTQPLSVFWAQWDERGKAESARGSRAPPQFKTCARGQTGPTCRCSRTHSPLGSCC